MQTLPVDPIDLSFLRLHSAVTPGLIASIVRLEQPPDISALKSRLADVAEIFPKLKMFIRSSKESGEHFWESNPEFTVNDISRPIIRMSQIHDQQKSASAVFATPLPEDRPFWEFSIFYLKELADVPGIGMFRFNHAMGADGLGGMEILHAITDDPTQNPRELPSPVPETPRVRESAGPLTGMLKKSGTNSSDSQFVLR